MEQQAEFLAAYDRDLRTDAETPSALAVQRLGPLRLVTFSGGRGFVTYPHLEVADPEQVAKWVESALAHFAASPEITSIEWKTRAHDQIAGLHDALVSRGFVPQSPESIMVGPASGLALEVSPPPGVTLRRVSNETDIFAMSQTADRAFGEEFDPRRARALCERADRADGMQLWIAEHDGDIIGTGRLEPVADTAFAGIWGGAVLPEWRCRGIYRALTSARARSALALGKTLVHSDSTAASRPILQRSGLTKVSETTPYVWRARPGHSSV